MTTLKQFLAELTYIQIKDISRHAKGLLLALEKSNRKEMLDYEMEFNTKKCSICGEKLYGSIQVHHHNEECKKCGYMIIGSQSHNCLK